MNCLVHIAQALSKINDTWSTATHILEEGAHSIASKIHRLLLDFDHTEFILEIGRTHSIHGIRNKGKSKFSISAVIVWVRKGEFIHELHDK